MNKKVMEVNSRLEKIFILNELSHGIPWDGMGRIANPMGWDENFFLRMGWDGMGRINWSHGTTFSSHPIPFGALVVMVIFHSVNEEKQMAYI